MWVILSGLSLSGLSLSGLNLSRLSLFDLILCLDSRFACEVTGKKAQKRSKFTAKSRLDVRLTLRFPFTRKSPVRTAERSEFTESPESIEQRKPSSKSNF